MTQVRHRHKNQAKAGFGGGAVPSTPHLFTLGLPQPDLCPDTCLVAAQFLQLLAAICQQIPHGLSHQWCQLWQNVTTLITPMPPFAAGVCVALHWVISLFHLCQRVDVWACPGIVWCHLWSIGNHWLGTLGISTLFLQGLKWVCQVVRQSVWVGCFLCALSEVHRTELCLS